MIKQLIVANDDFLDNQPTIRKDEMTYVFMANPISSLKTPLETGIQSGYVTSPKNLVPSRNCPLKFSMTTFSPGIPAAPMVASPEKLASGGTPKGRKGRVKAVTLHCRVFRLRRYSLPYEFMYILSFKPIQ